MGSVGSGTKIDHVQISYSNDDAFEWFGGTVNCTHIISYKTWDYDFDTDNGYNGNIQFGLSVRDPKIADIPNSNGFESDNWKDGTNLSPMTSPTFSNMTFVGPMALDPNFVNKAGVENISTQEPTIQTMVQPWVDFRQLSFCVVSQI